MLHTSLKILSVLLLTAFGTPSYLHLCFLVIVNTLSDELCNVFLCQCMLPGNLAHSNAVYFLLLSGEALHFNALKLIWSEKVSREGYQTRCQTRMGLLQQAGLGELREKKAHIGTDIVKLS